MLEARDLGRDEDAEVADVGVKKINDPLTRLL